MDPEYKDRNRLAFEVYDRINRLSRDLLDLQVARGSRPKLAITARIAGLYSCLIEALSHSRRVRNELPSRREAVEKLLAADLAGLITATLDRAIPRLKHTVLIIAKKK